MKKALIVLLILAVAGGLFAQSFSGSVKTGAYFEFDGDSPVNGTMEDGWRGQAVRGALNFSSGGDDWGVSIGTSANVADHGGAVTGISVEGFNGWVKFADIFKLTAGKGVGDAWYAFNVDAWSDMHGSAAGARIEVTPIDGLNLGVLFGYPKAGSNAEKLANFFQEIGLGAKYEASIFSAYASLQLDSPETTGGDMDATARFGVKVPVADILEFKLVGHVDNLFTGSKIWLEEKISGNIVGLGWYVWARENLGDPLKVAAHAGVDYGIPINDKAKVTVGADANLTIIEPFNFDSFDVWAELAYNFNGNVNTSFEFGIDGAVDPMKITPYLKWLIGYTF